MKQLAVKGTTSSIPPQHLPRIKKYLSALNAINSIKDIYTFPKSWQLHALKGDIKGRYSLKVSENWRLTFAVDGKDIIDIDYEDYH